MSDNKVILAFDYGDKRMGVAMGNTLLKIAHPVETVCAEGVFAKIDRVRELIAYWKPNMLVIGLPHEHESVQKTQLINTITNFAKKLKAKFNIPVIYINEDFTSSYAASLLDEQNVHGRNQHEKIDQLAACAILETYFSIMNEASFK